MWYISMWFQDVCVATYSRRWTEDGQILWSFILHQSWPFCLLFWIIHSCMSWAQSWASNRNDSEKCITKITPSKQWCTFGAHVCTDLKLLHQYTVHVHVFSTIECWSIALISVHLYLRVMLYRDLWWSKDGNIIPISHQTLDGRIWVWSTWVKASFWNKWFFLLIIIRMTTTDHQKAFHQKHQLEKK